MTYMVVEKFKDPKAIYARLAERGRMMPEGLTYVGSWIVADLSICYQVMETNDPALLEQWMANWSDLMEFEVFPTISSAEARWHAQEL